MASIPGIASALQQHHSPDTAYFDDRGSRVEDKAVDNSRPRLMSRELWTKTGMDMGSGRLAAMDEYGVDMQVLSYSNPTQFTPAAQAGDLARAANDRLAAAVNANPARFGGFATLAWHLWRHRDYLARSPRHTDRMSM